jgi:AcrR family transcriptional regulator
VLDAAIALYAEGGWAGFTFEAVTRRTGAGKASLYARWPSRVALLRRTFETRWLTVERIDTRSLAGDLAALGRMVFDTRTGPNGGAARWMAMDCARYPDVETALAPYLAAAVDQGRAIARRAIRRGELASDVNPGLIMDLLVGAVTNHVNTTPERLVPAMIARRDAFLSDLVAAVLRGVGAKG